jgi:hypothetical protein
MKEDKVFKVYCPELEMKDFDSKFIFGWKINEKTFCISHFSSNKKDFKFSKEKPEIIGKLNSSEFKFNFSFKNEKIILK